jgi:hypothetical protein
MADPQTKYLGVRVPRRLYEKVEQVLQAESLQITEYVKDLVRADLKKRGLLPQSEPTTAEVSA